ncbi:MAG: class I SAM-dependent methyltransferase [Desulfatirhabdiaceae bacterium]
MTSSSIRCKTIEQYVNVQKAHILEIGALDCPTYSKSDGYVKYLDYASKLIMAKKADGNSRYQIDKIVDVDYVCATLEYSKFIQEKFDLIIANHVIEHIPDTIRWLNEIHHVLVPGGKLFLSVPDKRYTFDIVRRNTTFVDMLRNYNNSVKKPDFYHILEHFYYHKSVTAQDVWNNKHLDKVKQYRFDPETAVAVAEKHAKDDYADVHCHVFTSDSFKELMDILIRLKRIDFQVIEITEPEKMQNEFYVVMARS